LGRDAALRRPVGAARRPTISINRHQVSSFPRPVKWLGLFHWQLSAFQRFRFYLFNHGVPRKNEMKAEGQMK
jgi:hypothetical protein